jgi:hypothetical protein
LNTSTDKAISEVVGVFTDPIIVYPGGWGDSLPEWLKNAITLERLEMNLRALKGEEVTGTEAEACAYLYTASLAASMDNDWVQIYLHISGRTCRRWGGKEMPADITVDSLNGEQTKDLRRLKGWLHQKRAQERGNRDRAERRQHKEEETERRKAEQPALFDF